LARRDGLPLAPITNAVVHYFTEPPQLESTGRWKVLWTHAVEQQIQHRACDFCDGVLSFSGGTFLTFLAAFAQNFILTALYVDCCCSGLWTAALLIAHCCCSERRQNSSARCLLFRGRSTPREHTLQGNGLWLRVTGRRHRHAHPPNADICK
jgi:hypothetical protein